MRAERLTDVLVEHGEGPVFSPLWPGPRWVDMLVGDVLELAVDGSISRRHVGSVATMLRPRRDGGFVIAAERGLLLAKGDAIDAPLTALPQVWSDTDVRTNEGGCDPLGNLYLGSMAYDSRTGGGKLYKFDANHDVAVVDDAVTISNGIDWTPDEQLAYYTDSDTYRVDVFDWAPDSGLTNRRPFAHFHAPGQPDGLTVDSEGGVWVAAFGGGAVRHYSAAGKLDEVIEVPAAQVTAVTFAGADLDQLIITTSRHGLAGSADPQAGRLVHRQPRRPGPAGPSLCRLTGPADWPSPRERSWSRWFDA